MLLVPQVRDRTGSQEERRNSELRFAGFQASLQLAPELKEEAKTDHDFDPLKGLPEFIALIS
jgi:hypothetical protein